MIKQYTLPHPFITESGATVQLTIGYSTYGTLNENKSNVVWVCHALTANTYVADWWPGVVGDGCLINPNEHFIVCANIIGSCYGTTIGLTTSEEYPNRHRADSPLITIRDMVSAHILLRKHLGINQIALLAGGSMGGYQVMEWALMEPNVPQRLLLLATSAAESPWGIAIHEAQRMAIEADCTWTRGGDDSGKAGLSAARAIGMLTYRNYALFGERQAEPYPNKIDNFLAATYQRHQGEKLTKRFTAQSYWNLTKSMDTHNIARGRTPTTIDALRLIAQPSLVIGITSDILCPVAEQRLLAANMPGAKLVEIDSPFGHDGFLTESAAISCALAAWLQEVV